MNANTPPHMKWLVSSGETIALPNGQRVQIWDLKYEASESILSEWARHFRHHYCDDADLPNLIQGTGLSNKEYLLKIKFPDASAAPGPSIRAGDFAEIL